MKRIKHVLLLFIAAGSFVSTVATAVPASNEKQALAMGATIAMQAQTMALFPSLKEYLDYCEQMHVFTSDNRKAIELAISKVGVDLSAWPPKVKVQGRKIHWGEVSLEVRDDGGLKTKDGLIIRLPKAGEGAPDLVFEKVFSALNKKSTASILNESLLPSAHAGEFGKKLDEAGSALSTAAGWAVSATVGSATGAGAGVASFQCGAVVILLDYAKYVLRRMIYNKTVECNDNGEYQYLKYPDYLSTLGSDFKIGWEAFRNPVLGGGSGLFMSLCVGPLFDLIGFSSISSKSANAIATDIPRAVPSGNIRAALRGEPDCTPENAAKVEAYLRDEAKKLEKEIAAASKEKKSGSSNGDPSSSKSDAAR